MADLIWIAIFSIALYPFMLVLLAVRLHPYRLKIDRYISRLAESALRYSFFVVFSAAVFGGLCFVPWILLLAIAHAGDESRWAFAPPFVAGFGWGIHQVWQMALVDFGQPTPTNDLS